MNHPNAEFNSLEQFCTEEPISQMLISHQYHWPPRDSDIIIATTAALSEVSQ